MYWFPAKRYGWGWGLPSSWQGWVVLAAFIGLLGVGLLLFRPKANLGPFVAYVLLLVALLFGICWLKGEPPRWRWGK
jgi:drug/metabolite transporter (DMT)-like permease